MGKFQGSYTEETKEAMRQMYEQLSERDRRMYAATEVMKLGYVFYPVLTVLHRLDDDRKKSVLQFLHESGLIYRDKGIIDLSGADLSGTNLSIISLVGV